MSVQAGVFYFDGRPIDPQLVRRIRESLAEFGPDGGGQVLLPGLAMVYSTLHLTPEDRLESQPLRSCHGHVLTWDGRLDNRDDLLLQLWRDLSDDTTDVAIALAAYERWGEAAFARMIGDWSLALWDGRTHEMKLASDYAGNRGLYYCEREGAVHWSTSLGELVERLDLREQLEPRFIVGYLAFAVPPDYTPYRDVWSVSTSHALTWTVGRTRRRFRFWDLSLNVIRYEDPREYEIQLRSVLVDAVKSRLRSIRPPWAELSGGFDSSTIVCIADQLIATGASVASSLETISYVTDTSPESDERQFIAAVEEQRGRKGRLLKAEACANTLDEVHGWVTPRHPAGVPLEFFRAVRQAGGRVLLSGHPGDLVMANYPESSAALVQHFAAREWRAFVSMAREWSRASRRPVWHAVAEIIAPYRSLHSRAIRLTRYSLPSGGGTSRDVMTAAAQAYLLTPSWLESWWSEKLRHTSRVTSYAHQWHDTLINGIVEYSDLRTLGSPSELAGVVHTHPYTDRRVVEYVLAIPPDVLNPPGQPRRLMKAAFACVLPAKVSRRFSKGYVDPFKLRKVRAWASDALAHLDSLFVVQEQYIDRNMLHAKLRTICDGSCRVLGNIEIILIFERWLDSRRISKDRMSLVTT
jgi:asparagine synthase (glutamine-hydrolysing)